MNYLIIEPRKRSLSIEAFNSKRKAPPARVPIPPILQDCYGRYQDTRNPECQSCKEKTHCAILMRERGIKVE